MVRAADAAAAGGQYSTDLVTLGRVRRALRVRHGAQDPAEPEPFTGPAPELERRTCSYLPALREHQR